MSRMNPSHFASIRLIRQSPRNSSDNDDRIRVYPLKGVEASGLKIKYYDGDIKDTHRSTFTGVTLYDYVLALLKGVTTEDCDQFKEIQFNFPGFPTLLYSMEAAGDKFVRSNILDITEMVWSSWAVEAAEEPVGGVAALEEQLEDEDSDEDTLSSTDEDESMEGSDVVSETASETATEASAASHES